MDGNSSVVSAAPATGTTSPAKKAKRQRPRKSKDATSNGDNGTGDISMAVPQVSAVRAHHSSSSFCAVEGRRDPLPCRLMCRPNPPSILGTCPTTVTARQHRTALHSTAHTDAIMHSLRLLLTRLSSLNPVLPLRRATRKQCKQDNGDSDIPVPALTADDDGGMASSHSEPVPTPTENENENENGKSSGRKRKRKSAKVTFAAEDKDVAAGQANGDADTTLSADQPPTKRKRKGKREKKQEAAAAAADANGVDDSAGDVDMEEDATQTTIGDDTSTTGDGTAEPGKRRKKTKEEKLAKKAAKKLAKRASQVNGVENADAETGEDAGAGEQEAAASKDLSADAEPSKAEKAKTAKGTGKGKGKGKKADVTQDIAQEADEDNDAAPSPPPATPSSAPPAAQKPLFQPEMPDHRASEPEAAGNESDYEVEYDRTDGAEYALPPPLSSNAPAGQIVEHEDDEDEEEEEDEELDPSLRMFQRSFTSKTDKGKGKGKGKAAPAAETAKKGAKQRKESAAAPVASTSALPASTVPHKPNYPAPALFTNPQTLARASLNNGNPPSQSQSATPKEPVRPLAPSVNSVAHRQILATKWLDTKALNKLREEGEFAIGA